MSDLQDTSRLSRLTATLILLQSKSIVTAADLAKTFGISKRTAYRDVKALEQAGVPIYTEEGKGYKILDGYYLPPVMFTEEEANALITAEQIISRNKDSSLVENHKKALTKIKAVLRSSKKEKANLLSNRVAYLKNYNNNRNSHHISSIQLAITNSTPLKLSYVSLYKKEESDRLIHPYGLYHTQENWILIAWCTLRNDFREFRLDQIQRIEQKRSSSFEPKEFDLMQYFMSKISSRKSLARK